LIVLNNARRNNGKEIMQKLVSGPQVEVVADRLDPNPSLMVKKRKMATSQEVYSLQ